MKQRIVFLAISLFITTMVMSQQPQGGQGQQRMNPEERVKRQTEQMVKDLGLNEAQTVKVTAINKKYGDKMAELFQSAGGDRDKMREKMQVMRTEKDAELKGVFTAEQYTKYLEMEKQRMEDRRKNNPNGPNGQNNQSEKRGQQRGTGEK